MPVTKRCRNFLRIQTMNDHSTLNLVPLETNKVIIKSPGSIANQITLLQEIIRRSRGQVTNKAISLVAFWSRKQILRNCLVSQNPYPTHSELAPQRVQNTCAFKAHMAFHVVTNVHDVWRNLHRARTVRSNSCLPFVIECKKLRS